MAEVSRIPTKTVEPSGMPQVWQPFERLRREMDRLFDDLSFGPWRTSFRRSLADFQRLSSPPVDIVEKDNAYEVTADVPGFDEKNIEVRLVNGSLCIKGERKFEKEEKKEDYYLNEREFGSFERRFELPEGVDPDKIEASLKKGVLTVMLPKKPEVQKPAKNIEVKPAG
jgi:HSP20 family protein